MLEHAKNASQRQCKPKVKGVAHGYKPWLEDKGKKAAKAAAAVARSTDLR